MDIRCIHAMTPLRHCSRFHGYQMHPCNDPITSLWMHAIQTKLEDCGCMKFEVAPCFVIVHLVEMPAKYSFGNALQYQSSLLKRRNTVPKAQSFMNVYSIPFVHHFDTASVYSHG
ncbi:unnamed protein product [Albugo candida]|uniref:Uncharacterized protein n=1 Tax=Albugo candida TaxID=65357 RepID=A0A024FWD1_9STRA|nr:unnamed protein product [Albugo candida]|eukprot:CCI11458.1 unnamed protein product [Albugo candida]